MDLKHACRPDFSLESPLAVLSPGAALVGEDLYLSKIYSTALATLEGVHELEIVGSGSAQRMAGVEGVEVRVAHLAGHT